MNTIIKVIIIVFILGLMVCALGNKLNVRYFHPQNNKKLYQNKTYHISLLYDIGWKLNPKYIEKYEGKNGFFQISAYSGNSLHIDEIVQTEVNHILKPYGSDPKIIKLNIQNQYARLIIPSEDQKYEFYNQAELIVKYPKPIEIGGENYYYFILWADKYNIQGISKTIRFLP